MVENSVSKKIIGVVILIIVSLISIFVLSPKLSSNEFHANTIKQLDEKKLIVTEISTATVGASTIIAAIPGDSTTPLANQILSLSSYLLIIIGAIFLEKMLLTLTGYVTFTFLIPIACLLYGIYLFIKSEALKNLALKLALFGLAIFIVVPVSVRVSDLIEKAYKDNINQTIEQVQNVEIATENSSNQDASNSEGWSGFTSRVKESVSNIGDSASKALEKGKRMLSNFIDAIAVLIITSCVIPIIVLISFLWIIKIIFSVEIKNPIIKNTKEKNQKETK